MTSLIITVRNEMPLFREWFNSIDSQIIQPDEIVIVDGGSNDGTWEYVQDEAVSRHNVRVVQKLGNIAVGRNAAIALSKGDVVVVTDAGCTYDPAWLRDLVEPIVGGVATVSTTAFAPWLHSTDGILPRAIAACTMPAQLEFIKNWLPSSRSFAFRKEVVLRAGGYPEWIPFCEDVLLDKTLLKNGEKFVYVRTPHVYWRPRLSIFAYLKQVYNYTRSEAHARINLWRHVLRHIVYILFPLSLLFVAQDVLWWYLFAGFLLYAYYMYKYLRRAAVYMRHIRLFNRLGGYFSTIIFMAIGDIAKIIGWWRGVLELGRIRKI